MNRNELGIAAVLLAFILAGLAYDHWRGANKTAEISVVHSDKTPFDSGTSIKEPPRQAQATLTIQHLSPTEQWVLQYLNRANLSQLMEIPGIGEAIGKRIITERRIIKSFKSMEDVLAINGIGTAKFEDMLQFIQTLQNRTPTPLRQITPFIPFYQRKTPIKQQFSNQPKNLNAATAEDIKAISGFGDALADSILKAREQKGRFKSWDELDAISGIGEQRLKQLKEHFILR